MSKYLDPIFVLAGTLVLVGISLNLKSINRRLKRIMKSQEEFDRQVAEINAKLDQVGEQIAAESQQIRDFIAQNPSVDTSALDGVVARLDSLNVSGIFEPPTAEEPPTEGEPTTEPGEGSGSGE
jgi:septal ring factor EnvC (AmiA/AmiB activator)